MIPKNNFLSFEGVGGSPKIPNLWTATAAWTLGQDACLGSQYQFFQVLSPVTSMATGQVSFPRGRLQLEVYSTSTWTKWRHKCDLSDSKDKSGSSDLNLDFEMFFILLSSLVLIILVKWGFERRAKFHILANYGYNVSWTIKCNICKR